MLIHLGVEQTPDVRPRVRRTNQGVVLIMALSSSNEAAKIQSRTWRVPAAAPSRCDMCHSTRLRERYSCRVDDGSVQLAMGWTTRPARPVTWLDLSKSTHVRCGRPVRGEIDEGGTA